MRVLLIFTLFLFLLNCSHNKADHFRFYKYHDRIGDGYSSYKNKIYYKRSKASYSSTLHFPVKTEAHYKTFSLLGNRYARDKDNIFYRGEIISNLDKGSFSVIQIEDVFPFYTKQVLNPQFDEQIKQNQQKDIIKTSSSLIKYTIANEIAELEYYAKDKRSIFYGKNVIPNADAETFILLSILFSKDKSNAYFKGKPIPNSESENFELIGGYMARDRNHIYFCDKIISSNPEAFKILSNNYAKDDKKVWFFRQMIFSKVDILDVSSPNEFEIIDNRYAKDRANVYFHGSVIDNANVEHFQILGKNWSKDDRNIFFCHKLCREADYNSFEVTDEYVKDKNRYYDKKYRPKY